MNLCTREQMQEMDRQTIEEVGISGLVLMEIAGRSAASALHEHLITTHDPPPLRTGIFCGGGNNGGDGYVIARHLDSLGYDVDVVMLARPESVEGDAWTNLEILRRLSPNIIILQDYLEDITVESLQDFLPPYEIYVDALFGTGLSGNVSGHYLHTIKYLNEALGFKFAVDIPSGLNANTGKTLGVAFKADLTCTLGMAKNGLFLQHGRQIAGKTLVADIGILPETENSVGIQGELLTKKSMQTVCYPRARHSHKGMLGHLGIIAGSNNMPGAAILSTGGAVASGTGLITVLTASEVRHPLIGRFPEAMLLPVLPDYGTLNENHLIDLERFLKEKNALVFGPGLGLEPMVSTLLSSVLQTAHIPVVIDADGLTALADDMSPLYETLCPVVLTPHPGEMARLTDIEPEQGMEDPVQWALSLAQQYRCYVVLKCATTILASPDGRYAVNSSGNPGMATGGSGDVLSGLLGGLLASGVPPWDAARLAIYLHGIAGDLAAEKSGLRALRALDIMEQLSHALADFE